MWCDYRCGVIRAVIDDQRGQSLYLISVFKCIIFHSHNIWVIYKIGILWIRWERWTICPSCRKELRATEVAQSGKQLPCKQEDPLLGVMRRKATQLAWKASPTYSRSERDPQNQDGWLLRNNRVYSAFTRSSLNWTGSSLNWTGGESSGSLEGSDTRSL